MSYLEILRYFKMCKKQKINLIYHILVSMKQKELNKNQEA